MTRLTAVFTEPSVLAYLYHRKEMLSCFPFSDAHEVSCRVKILFTVLPNFRLKCLHCFNTVIPIQEQATASWCCCMLEIETTSDVIFTRELLCNEIPGHDEGLTVE